METTIERRSETEVRVNDKLYAFDSRESADRFEQCVREGNPSQCVADYPPLSTSAADSPNAPHRADEGITIAPPPGTLGDDAG